MTLLAIIGALALASIPLTLGWRRTAGEAGMARALGLAPPARQFDPDKFARQTGTGLTFPQLVLGLLAWMADASAIFNRACSCCWASAGMTPSRIFSIWLTKLCTCASLMMTKAR